jgi:hypothetical protein
MDNAYDCSLILLIETREYNFVNHLLSLHDKLNDFGLTHDIVLAVNGPSRFVDECLSAWPASAPMITRVDLTRKISSAVCLQSVVPSCSSDLLVICGPYQQLEYDSLKDIIAVVDQGQVDLAMPKREKRIDPFINRCQSWVFNWLVRKITGMPFHDLSCLVRVVRRSVMTEIPLYGDLYRYLPLLAMRRGFIVREFAVAHHQELGQVGYYGIREYISRFVDLIGMHFTFGFARKPLRYFGLRGFGLAVIGGFCVVVSLAQRLLWQVSLGDSGLLMAGLLLFVFGFCVWGIGLLGEVMTFVFGRNRKDYIIEKTLGQNHE